MRIKENNIEGVKDINKIKYAYTPEQKLLDYIMLRYQGSINPGKTGDDILDNYYFCNIKRQWDAVSKYITDYIILKDHFRNSTKKMTFEDKLRNIFLARIHNKVETLEQYKVPQKSYKIIDKEIIKKQNPHAYRMQKFLKRLKRETIGWTDSCWCVGNYLEILLPDEKLKSLKWDTFKSAIKSWAMILNLSENSFFAYQLALDLDWLFMYQDIDEYVILGPGSIRGINMIYFEDKFNLKDNFEYEMYEEDKKPMNKNIYSEALEGVNYFELIFKLQKYINSSLWAKNHGIYIHINDIEFNLCEYNKWNSKKKGLKTTLRKFSKDSIND